MSSQRKNTYLNPRNTNNPKHFPYISQPKIVGSFSIDENRQYLKTTQNCKYLYHHKNIKELKLDLNNGIEEVIRKHESCQDEKLTHLLQFISNNLSKLRCQDSMKITTKILEADFVCFRGLLRLIMCTPYEHREPWIILATKYKGTIYLCAEETEKRIQERRNEGIEMKKILSYGFKFEQYLLSDDPGKEPITNVPVNENEEFCCMFSSSFNGQKMLYGAEMDGIESNEVYNLDSIDLNKFNFIELKVKLREQHERQRKNYYRFKLRNWWCQSFLANVQKIIVGTRTPNGLIEDITTMFVKDIPKQNRNFWSPAVCMEFCNQFLKYVSMELAGINNPKHVCRFEYDPINSDTIFMTKYDNTQHENIILPDWYIECIEKNSALDVR